MEKIKIGSLTPEQILNDPLLNKGTAFTLEERDALGLHGLLPCHVSTMQEQLTRRYQNFQERTSPLAKYAYLSSLQNRNEILFYRLIYEHVSEMLPLIYTPTVGDVSLFFSLLYRKNRGAYISYPLKDKMESLVDALSKDVDVIVVTDGERVLGLGDVGIGGMAISQGKLILYTLFGGIHPSRSLPIVLDVGTNNPSLLKDPLYLGWRHPRITGKEYDDFLESFIQAIQKRFPKALLQWEDFAKPRARPLLERYRNRICSFNDDIQGTAAVVLAAILSALKASGQKLTEQKFAILGAGSAGLGIAELIFQALCLEGCAPQEAYRKFYIIDIDGLVTTQMYPIDPDLKPFAHSREELASWNLSPNTDKIALIDVVNNAQPTVLIGVCAQAKMFTESVIKTMASYCQRPIILPLSNPTSHSEADPQSVMQWTQGKAFIATGSPFEPVSYEGKSYSIAQCNNVYIFPGVGLGAIVSQTPKIIDEMFIAAAQVLSDHSPMLSDPAAPLFPDLHLLPGISREIAKALFHVAQEKGLISKLSSSEIDKRLDHQIWFPEYPTLFR
ncbi:MAG TPA: NAD-dependent malic enzyme [Rhabdochlamydiaceae bacterium]|jgi:malate dehydrogenase (oxaloacetate-decarboxylating)